MDFGAETGGWPVKQAPVRHQQGASNVRSEGERRTTVVSCALQEELTESSARGTAWLQRANCRKNMTGAPDAPTGTRQ
jgi:hypothetical protein